MVKQLLLSQTERKNLHQSIILWRIKSILHTVWRQCTRWNYAVDRPSQNMKKRAVFLWIWENSGSNNCIYSYNRLPFAENGHYNQLTFKKKNKLAAGNMLTRKNNSTISSVIWCILNQIFLSKNSQMNKQTKSYVVESSLILILK